MDDLSVGMNFSSGSVEVRRERADGRVHITMTADGVSVTLRLTPRDAERLVEAIEHVRSDVVRR